MCHDKRGFTIVELVIVISIIAILATLATIGLSRFQAEARDSKRTANTATVSDALEVYFQKNGEYPSVRNMVNSYPENTVASVAGLLNVSEDVLSMPQSTNNQSIVGVGSGLPGSDRVVYDGQSTVNNDTCLNSTTGGCDRYTLTYITEAGETITLKGRQDGAIAATVATAPAKPVLSTAQGATTTDIKVTSTDANCAQNADRLVAKYSFRSRINGGAWTAWSAQQASRVYDISGLQGQAFDFQGQSRCDDSTQAGAVSPDSDTVSRTILAVTPAAPAITVVLSGGNVLATSGTVTCLGSTTAQYGLRSRTNNGTWGAYSAWSTTLTATQVAAQGVKYDYQSQARCYAAATTSAASTSAVGTYTHPIATPATPVMAAVTLSASVATWSWNATTCPAGTTAYYQYQSEANWNYISAWTGPYASYTSNTWASINEGYTYIRRVQTRCSTAYADSAWSAVATASRLMAISTPAAPTAFSSSMSGDKKYAYTTFTLPTCGAGTTNEWQYMTNWDGTTTFPGTWGATGLVGYAPPVTQVYTDSNGNYVAFSSGSKIRAQVRSRCTNTTTGLTGAWGPVGISPAYTVP